MSSEAVTYFHDTQASTTEARQPAHREAEIFTNPHDKAASQCDAAARHAGANTQIVEISDELLMEQVRQGTKEALSHIFRRHARAVRNVAYRILRNEAEADDLEQDVFLFIFRKSASLDRSHGPAQPGL